MPSVLDLCNGTQFCTDGFCVTEVPIFCPDGTPALWLGTATSALGITDIAFTICASGEFVSGVFSCLPGSLACFGSETATFGTVVIGVDGVTIFFDPLIFADGSTCTFSGSLIGFTMGGDFVCLDLFGFVVSTGTWTATRCP